MTQGGFYQQKSLSPTGMTIVVLLHGAAIAALMLTKMDLPIRIKDPPLVIDPIAVPPPPPPHPVPKPPHPQVETRVTTVPPPPFHQPVDPTFRTDPFPTQPPPDFGDSGSGPRVEPPPPPPPPPPPRTVEPARARTDLARYVSDADYPDAALRGGEQGATRFRLQVGADGRVTGCTVTGSSGSSALDSATCRLMKSRARFTPARDSTGKPTTDSVASTIRWVLPDG
jgi:protein TonB